MTKPKTHPKWTVLYNVCNKSSPWIGTGREFFDNEYAAEKRYSELLLRTERWLTQYVPTIRPYHEKVDSPHLGAVYKMQE